MRLIASIESILEDLVNNGKCISVVYDDNGNWAISDIGVLSLNESGEICITNIIPRGWFKPTLNEALIHYLIENEYYTYIQRN